MSSSQTNGQVCLLYALSVFFIILAKTTLTHRGAGSQRNQKAPRSSLKQNNTHVMLPKVFARLPSHIYELK